MQMPEKVQYTEKSKAVFCSLANFFLWPIFFKYTDTLEVLNVD